MNIDNKTFEGLIEESQDLHVDAMREVRETLPALEEIREERRGEVDTDEIDRFNTNRRQLLSAAGIGAGGLAARGLVYGSLGTLFTGLMAKPAYADKPLDIQILQTASSLESLAINTYGAALGQSPQGANAPAAKAVAGISVASAKDVVAKFAMTTQSQHDEHKKAFQAQTVALGGKSQNEPNPKFAPVVAGADLSTPLKLVEFAATLEKVATDTYLTDLSLLEDMRSKEIMTSVMGVEAQHLAVLRAVGALLGAGAPELIKIPIGADVSKLPDVAGSVAFPDALEQTDPQLIAEPTTGAVA